AWRRRRSAWWSRSTHRRGRARRRRRRSVLRGTLRASRWSDGGRMTDNIGARPAVVFLWVALLVVVLSGLAHAAQVQVNGRTFTVPDGFTVELVAGPPLVDRPIIADFDERGRLYVADSSGSTAKVEKQLAERPHRIVRLEDADGDGRYERQTVFADHMVFPEGAMWFGG